MLGVICLGVYPKACVSCVGVYPKAFQVCTCVFEGFCLACSPGV